MQNHTQDTGAEVDAAPSVAVIGTGTMGAAVARRLLHAGMAVHVWNRSQRPAVALAELGATAFDDPGDAVAGVGVVLTFLPTIEHLSEVMIGRQVIEAMAPRAVWAQMGTIGVEATEALVVEALRQRADVRFVDAPVSGSRQPAETGALLVLASGPEDAKAAVRPVFDAIGRRTLWLGRAGMGSRVKLVLNTWLAFEVEAAAEGAAIAARLGIPPSVLRDALEGNGVASPLAVAKLSKIDSADHRADFSLQWELKDLDLMRASVGDDPAPIAVAITERWRHLVDQGFGALDVSAARLGLGAGVPARSPAVARRQT